ncbi:MAG: arcadin 1 [Candidatus Bathyarchaeia archaeon]
MIRVRVQRIESIRDPDGNLGKRIELVEERKVPRFAIEPPTEEARMVQGVVQALQQQLTMFPKRAEFSLPKIILFLTEQEYEELGIDFDVNQIYELELASKTVQFRKAPR